MFFLRRNHEEKESQVQQQYVTYSILLLDGLGIRKGIERNKLLNFNNKEVVNVHNGWIKCEKLLIPHIKGENQLICRLIR